MHSFLRLTVLLAIFICSEGNSLSRIIGGQSIPISDVPWQASLQRLGSHICGASFIHNKWLVTAAHCVNNQNKNDLSVGYGDADKRNHKTASILSITMHPQYEENGSKGYPNDVALLELTSPVSFDSNTNKVALPRSSNTLTNCAITGWGCTNNILGFCTSTPNLLQGTTITKIQPDACKSLWSDTQIQAIHVCVNEADKSGCNGDSGGPLSCYQDGGIVLAGATSWGSSTCSSDYPTVYARISEFVGWIDATTGYVL
ncbi:chymotrypsin B-like [Mercenaria mercenaria]|uniref:chymotrypsin B-like n=1 Tax=Mercenaria mercenaria TaxID=6596 RepID=UPI001E1D5DC6|nr:chymotrypsin B-like [Mercenaria mercenaria]